MILHIKGELRRVYELVSLRAWAQQVFVGCNGDAAHNSILLAVTAASMKVDTEALDICVRILGSSDRT